MKGIQVYEYEYQRKQKLLLSRNHRKSQFTSITKIRDVHNNNKFLRFEVGSHRNCDHEKFMRETKTKSFN